jgi:hypothetical protein
MQPADTHVARVPRPRSSTDCTTAASSSGGSVFGMQTTAVQPPSAAARGPSRRLRLLAPGFAEVHLDVDETGRDHAALGVEHGAPAPAPARLPTSATDPSTHERRAPRSRLVDDASARSRQLRQSDLPIPGATTTRPCGRRPVRDLFGHERPGRVGDLRRDLDAAVHRAGVHHSVSGFSRAAAPR